MQQQKLMLFWCYWCIVNKRITDSLTPEKWRYIDSKSSITVLSLEPFFWAQICTKSYSGLGLRPRPHWVLTGKGEGKEGRGGKRKEWNDGNGRGLPPLKFKSATPLSKNAHNSWSSTTQVLEHGQWMVTTGTLMGWLIEFYSTETANVLKI